MKVVLLMEWMGRRKGSTVNLVDGMARELIERGTAKSEETEKHQSFRKKSKNRMMMSSPVEKQSIS